MNLDTVMTEVATRLDTIVGLRVVDHPVDEIQPPTAIVSLPQITFDQTYGRGSDRYALPVVLAVGKVSDRASRNNLAPYVAGSGAKSVKAVLEGFTAVSFDAVRVQGVEFDVISWGTVEYLTATFLLDIMGSGA
jgi:hypothetical protein